LKDFVGVQANHASEKWCDEAHSPKLVSAEQARQSFIGFISMQSPIGK
jgi:hypothetical protein